MTDLDPEHGTWDRLVAQVDALIDEHGMHNLRRAVEQECRLPAPRSAVRDWREEPAR